VKLHIQLLHDHEAVHDRLRRHGWRLDKVGNSRYAATHPAVVDQATARDRLHTVGLLTSSALRIQFEWQCELTGTTTPTPPGQ
jgi:hypothetical protein